MDYIKKVEEFHKKFNVPVLEKPQIPSKDRCDLRISLLQEEVEELKDAIENNDLVEIADACGDILVILSGTILEFGLKDVFNDIFENIHESNMSKACNSENEARETLEYYIQKNGTECYYKENNGNWLVYRKSDDKVLKSINYKPASLEQIINGYSK
jgi:predicted HAD superfamily Cof-like phosphohydrolase